MNRVYPISSTEHSAHAMSLLKKVKKCYIIKKDKMHYKSLFDISVCIKREQLAMRPI